MAVSIDLSGGGSVIVFETPSAIIFQRYNASHQPIGSAVTVAGSPAVWFTATPLSTGGFSVIWDTSVGAAPVAQDYDANGSPVGAAHAPASLPLGQTAFVSRQNVVSSSSSTALLPDGGYVVAHVEQPQGGAVTVHVQRYDSASNPIGAEFVRNVGIDLVSELTVAPTANGGYVVSYVDTFNYSVSLTIQQFAPDGTFLETATPAQYGGIPIAIYNTAVAGLPDGGFVAVWTGTNNGQPTQIYASEFNSSGAAVGSAQALGAPASSSGPPQIDVFSDGRYIVNWTSATGSQHSEFTEAGTPITPHDNGLILTAAVAYTMPAGPHDVTLIGAVPQSATGNAQDNVITSNDYASTLNGAGGNDTLIAGHNSVILAGGSGADTFSYPYLPWNAGHITDFSVGTDKLDLHTLFASSGYSGSDPVADGYMQLASDGSGGTLVLFDADGPAAGASWTLITTLDHVSPAGLTVAALLGQTGQAQHHAASDFNGDSKSDVLWQSDSGQAAVWLMNGASQIGGGGAGPNPGAAWHIKASADFDGDSKADILWQNSDGTPVIWFMNGSTLTSGAVAGFNPGSAWHIVGAEDFNADGHADILWQNSDGTPAIWLMNGANVIGGASLTNPGSTWHVIGAGDFNGDGKADILWQSDQAQAAVWLMNGTSLVSGSGVGPNPGTAWHVKGAGDFDGDGRSDILWQNTDGTAVIWFMNGTNLVSGAVAGGFNPGSTWHALGASDLNGDSHADILWQNDNGTPAVWLMSGSTLLSGAALSNPGSSWHPLVMTS